jgi:hypothetical protein
MYEAMRYARLAIANAPTAARTWGAYQHYGDPFFRLLDSKALSQTALTRTAADDHFEGPPAPWNREGNGSSEVTSDSQKGPAPVAVIMTTPANQPAREQTAAAKEELEPAAMPTGPAAAGTDRLEAALATLEAPTATGAEIPTSEPSPRDPAARPRRRRRAKDDQ